MGEFKPQILVDVLQSFDGGVNQQRSPLKLPRNVMARATNTTVRGDFVSHRPPYQKRLLTYENDVTKALFEGGLFQGACDYQPDNDLACLVAAVSGMLFRLQVSVNTITVKRVDGGETQDPTALQHWLWQAEKWVIWNDGGSLPVFYDNISAVRSNYGSPTSIATTTASLFYIPAIGSTVNITVSDATGIVVNDVITVENAGIFTVQVIAGAVLTATNNSALPLGNGVFGGSKVSLTQAGGIQLPAGRMGAYGMGRIWMALTDGKQFVAGDIVGGSSGTPANNFRDAVLCITENTYLLGGGTFAVPGTPGDIQAMRFTSTLDVSLGQGPLQVVTPTKIFSCNAPVDRLTWQSLTNPILTESLITNGGKGQNSTVLANGDMMFRSIDGLRSLILARREFNTWGNTPISYEVNDILAQDDPGLLRYGSAVVFDNRLLMTAHPVTHAQGVYHKGLIPLNFDPVSSLSEKQPSVYDSAIWTGINTLQLVLGQFNGVERAFSFVLNTTTGFTRLELWELLKSKVDSNGNAAPETRFDNDGERDIRILWGFKSASLNFGQDDPRGRELLKLIDGEMSVSDLVGTVHFRVSFQPDQYPCPTPCPWREWDECQGSDGTDSKPGFRPRLGLGEPKAGQCDIANNRPLREGYTFQMQFLILGHCTFLGARFKATTQPQAEFTRPNCSSICP